MNEKNYDYLANQVKYAGFGEQHHEALKAAMIKGEAQFMLTHQQDYGKDSTVATLHFRKSDQQDMYFFNRFDLLLKNQQHPEPIKQSFYIHAGQDNVTLKEGYNLLSGRSVLKEMTNKEGEKYQAWLQLDFKQPSNQGFDMRQYNNNYGYDLQATLARFPIKELQNETERTRLMESLQRGNRQSVTLVKDGNDQKVFVEAVPKFKTLQFYDLSNGRLQTQTLATPAVDNKQGQEKAAENSSMRNDKASTMTSTNASAAATKEASDNKVGQASNSKTVSPANAAAEDAPMTEKKSPRKSQRARP
jgi:cell wall assembly regulator SMI1